MGKKDSVQGLKAMKNNVAHAFSKVKDELTEHLDAINQNTTELTATQQMIVDLEKKIDKLSERVDELSISNTTSKVPTTIDLTIREQEVFLALYTADEKKTPEELARYIGLTQELVLSYITKLMTKGVSILRSVHQNNVFYLLEPSFKDLQARKNIVEINEDVVKEFIVEERG